MKKHPAQYRAGAASVVITPRESTWLAGLAVRTTPSRGAINDLRGLIRRSPGLAIALALFLTALAGLPPGVAGLFAKVAVLREAVHGHVVWLAVVAAVNAVIGLAYYLRVAALLFVESGDEARPDDVPGARRLSLAAVGLGLSLAATVALSVYPQPLFHWAKDGARAVLSES
jgi:NADH-quinone oxidoreductase subunit N